VGKVFFFCPPTVKKKSKIYPLSIKNGNFCQHHKERKSWVVWDEKKTLDIIIELLSEKTATTNKGKKKLIFTRTN